MNKKEREDWEKVRAKGKVRFILINGIVFWAIPFAILFYTLMRVWDYFDSQPDSPSSFNLFLIKVVFNLMIFSAAGCIIFRSRWNEREREFLREQF